MKYIFIFTMLFFGVSSYAATYGDAECNLVGIVDGDTIKCDIPEFPDIIGRNISVRFRGINTPEIHGEQKELGYISKRKLEALIGDNKKITLKDISRDKYFRIDADIFVGSLQINKDELLQP